MEAGRDCTLYRAGRPFGVKCDVSFRCELRVVEAPVEAPVEDVELIM